MVLYFIESIDCQWPVWVVTGNALKGVLRRPALGKLKELDDQYQSDHGGKEKRGHRATYTVLKTKNQINELLMNIRIHLEAKLEFTLRSMSLSSKAKNGLNNVIHFLIGEKW